MPHPLTQADIAGFLARVPQASADIETHHLSDNGTAEMQWKLSGNVGTAGKVYRDGNSFVLVHIDETYNWHFDDVTDMPSVIANAGQRDYQSPWFTPDIGLVKDILLAYGSGPSGGFVDTITQAAQHAEQSAKDLFSSIQAEFDKLEKDVRNIIILAVLGVVAIAIAVAVKGVKAPGLEIG